MSGCYVKKDRGVLKFRFAAIFFVLVFCFSFTASAKISKEIKDAVLVKYVPAVSHPGLDSAQQPLEPEKLRTAVVVMKGDVIPAERAFYLITPQNYDYRGAIVEGEKVKTRAGKPYIYIPRGTVMVVADDVFSGKTIYLKLLSIKKITSPINPKKKPTRVTVMLGFKFDKSILESGDASQVLATIDEWVKPFNDIEEAMKYGDTIAPPPLPESTPEPKPEIVPDE